MILEYLEIWKVDYKSSGKLFHSTIYWKIINSNKQLLNTKAYAIVFCVNYRQFSSSMLGRAGRTCLNLLCSFKNGFIFAGCFLKYIIFAWLLDSFDVDMVIYSIPLFELVLNGNVRLWREITWKGNRNFTGRYTEENF